MSMNSSGQQSLKPVMGLRPPNEIMFEESFWDEMAKIRVKMPGTSIRKKKMDTIVVWQQWAANG